MFRSPAGPPRRWPSAGIPARCGIARSQACPARERRTKREGETREGEGGPWVRVARHLTRRLVLRRARARMRRMPSPRFPHPLVLLTGCILAAAIGSFLLPAGEYDRRDDPVTNRKIV